MEIEEDIKKLNINEEKEKYCYVFANEEDEISEILQKTIIRKHDEEAILRN